MQLLDRRAPLATFSRLITTGRLWFWLTWYLCLQTLLSTVITAAPVKHLASKDRRHRPQTLTQRSPGNDFHQQPTRYDWCEAGGQTKTMDFLLKTLERMEEYPWASIELGLQGIREYTQEMDKYAAKVMLTMEDQLGPVHDPGLVQAMPKAYLNWVADDIPQADRLTLDYDIQMVITGHQMARMIEDILRTHADTLSRIMVRLALVEQTEEEEGARSQLKGYVGEMRMMLCNMQNVFQKVAPDDYLPGPYPDSDLHPNETDTIGQNDTPIMRIYGTMGVVVRHREILESIVADLHWLENQIADHTMRRS